MCIRDRWEPILPLGIRDLQAIIGTEPIDAVDKYYREDHADGTAVSYTHLYSLPNEAPRAKGTP